MKSYWQYIGAALTATLCLLVAGVTVADELPKEEVTYYHYDALGSPIMATDQDGNIKWREQYAPYGERLLEESREEYCEPVPCEHPPNSQWENRNFYTGKYHEPDIGLVYYGARWYDPSIGRFIEPDPVEFHEENLFSFNKYAYANNNPYGYVDPDGKLAILAVIAVAYAGFEIASSVHDIYSAARTVSDPEASSSAKAIAVGSAVAGMALPGSGKLYKSGAEVAVGATKGSKKVPTDPPIQQVDPRNLIPTQTRNEISGSQVKRLKKDMQKNGFDQSQPVDAVRNSRGRREIEDGHHRTEAARKAGIDKIPVRVSGE